jgi:hypothetical protein
VEQGRLAAQSLYEARQNELTSLATLAARRPMLRQLLAQKDWSRLSGYLATLQHGSGPDAVVVCGAGSSPRCSRR